MNCIITLISFWQTLTREQKEGAFSNFPISEETIKLLKGRGVTYLFPIQVKTFGPVYEGKDLIAQAWTGIGKTFSFAIPLIERLQRNQETIKKSRSPKVLVLAPTRELANQVAEDFKDITRKLSVACFYGGTSYQSQINHIWNGIDILVGTPGCIKDHLQSGRLDLSKLRHIVLDEVDQMLDLGFAEQVEDILHEFYKTDSEDNPQTFFCNLPTVGIQSCKKIHEIQTWTGWPCWENDSKGCNDCRTFGHPVPLVSETSSYWRCPSSLQWVWREG